MLNFLLQKNKKQITNEYLLRVSALLLLFVFISSLLIILLFIPSFFFVKYKNDTVKKQFESVRSKDMTDKDDPVVFIKDVNALSAALYDGSPYNFSYSMIIDKIVSLKNNDIKILSINIIEENGSGFKKVQMSGIAKTRDALSSYEKDIKSDVFFDSVIFPVSSFIKSSDSEFSATLIYKNK